MDKMKKMSGFAGVLLILGILIAVNVVLRPVRARVDMTQDKLYTLSDGTKQLLSSLDRDVTLKFYFSASNERLPVPLKNFASRIRDLLREYEARSGGYLVVEEYDPKPDSDDEEWAQRYGLKGQALDPFGAGGELYLGVVGISGNNEAVIPVLAEDMESRLEYLLTRLISEVSMESRATVGMMSALPVQGSGSPYGGGSAPWAIVSELESQYEVRTVGLQVKSIPEDIDTLVLIHPADLSNQTLYAIDQFVLRGGRLLAFCDPMSVEAQASMNPQQMQMGMSPPATSSDLNQLTSAWGISMDNGQLAADQAAATMLNAGGGRADRNPTWLSLRDSHINQDEVITSSLSDLMLPFAGAFEGEPEEGLTRTDLLFTEADGFLVNSYAARSGNVSIPTDRKKLPLAIRLTGTFKTAFPEGAPASEDTDGSEKDTEGLQESVKPGIVVLVADSDMIADRFAVQQMNFFGQTVTQPANDNLTFAVNMVEQLCGSEALIGLRSRTAFDRPFDRVIELEKEATIKWQAEEERLNEKLRATQSRISQLKPTQKDGQQMILSPEQKTEIKKFREEAFQTQQSLKEVRKNLRRDIEQLGMRLKVLNILGVALLVATFGIVRGIRSRRG